MDKEKWQDLVRPLPVYKWKIQNYIKDKTMAVIVPYFDARDLEMRLDEVLTPEGWQDDYKQVKNTMFCGIGIKTEQGWLWKWGAGVEAGGSKSGDDVKLKGEASDAFKLAGVKWGIFRDVYQLGNIYIDCRLSGKFPILVDKSGKEIKAYKLNEYIYKNYKFENGRMVLIKSYEPQQTKKVESEKPAETQKEMKMHQMDAIDYVNQMHGDNLISKEMSAEFITTIDGANFKRDIDLVNRKLDLIKSFLEIRAFLTVDKQKEIKEKIMGMTLSEHKIILSELGNLAKSFGVK